MRKVFFFIAAPFVLVGCFIWGYLFPPVQVPPAHPFPSLRLRPEGYVSPFEKFCVDAGKALGDLLKAR
jgi:hypothetical protein